VATSRYCDEFRPGEVLVSEPFTLTAGDLVAFGEVSGDRHPMHTPGAVPDAALIGHGPFGVARYFGSVFASGVLADTVIVALDTNWRFRAPLRIGARLHYETTVTGWRRTTDRSRGVLHRFVRLLDDAGVVVQEGSTAALVRTAEAAEDDPPWAMPLGLAWSRAVAAALRDVPAFQETTQLFDGTIEWSSELANVQFRIYKGQIIDVATRTPAGPTFTVHASAEQWCALLMAPRNDFIARAQDGTFAIRGSAYTYLQMTKALHLMIDAGRSVMAGVPR
jgi:acyl dehydratase